MGAPDGTTRVSVGADGELVRSAVTYNVALDGSRTLRHAASLITADPLTLARLGVSPDSIAALVVVSDHTGMPIRSPRAEGSQAREGLTWLGRLDDTRDSLHGRTLTTYAEVGQDRPLGLSPLVAPSTAGTEHRATLGGQLVADDYLGVNRLVLTESRLALSTNRFRRTHDLSAPSASVLVSSADASASPQRLELGGGGGDFDERGWTGEAANETYWNADGRRHRFKTQLWLRLDGLDQAEAPDPWGSYSYASLADLASNRPSSMTRVLRQPRRVGTVWNAAAAFAHVYAPSRFLSVIYGARVEGDGPITALPHNPALEDALAATSGMPRVRLHVSPRIGVTYTYDRDQRNTPGTTMNATGTFYRAVTGTIRAGIGDFRDLLSPGVVADAVGASGLPGSMSVLSCVGVAAPGPQWSPTSASAAPTQCVDGVGALADPAPPVRLVDPAYDVPHRWRASLGWTSSVGPLVVQLDGLASYDLAQPGIIDRNFAGRPQFVLADEGGRPMFVSPDGIDPTSGLVSPVESRRVASVGSVISRVSDLRGYAGQVTARVSPDVIARGASSSLFASLAYSLQASRRQYRGFDDAAFGDPRSAEWSPGNDDVRHVVVLTAGIATHDFGVLTLFGRFQSGLPFSPLVQGDVSGDGVGRQRAFIPDPAVAGDTLLGRKLRTLLASGSSTARACIASQMGHVPERNGCRGPWSASLNMQWGLPTPSRWGRRVVPSLYVQNVLGGVDQALHGSANLRGWGSPVALDPVLLVPRGFDVDARRFLYDVNARFADRRSSLAAPLNPFRIIFDVAVDLTTDFDVQQLRRAIEPRRSASGYVRRTADDVTSLYLGRTSSIYKLLLAESDSLLLSEGQARALHEADSVYSAQVRSLFVPLGQFLAGVGERAAATTLDSVRTTQRNYRLVFWQQPEIAAGVLSPMQRSLIPILGLMLAVPPAARPETQFSFGYPVRQ
jgi:hypothetical protein